MGDVSALHKLLLVMKQSPLFANLVSQSSMSLDSAVAKLEHQMFTRNNLETMQQLVDDKILSAQMAKKAASSGLRLSHLKAACNRCSSGIKELFSERTSANKPRVSCMNAICDRVQQYMEKH